MRRHALGCLGILLLISAEASAAAAPAAFNAVVNGTTVTLSWIPGDPTPLRGYQLEAGLAPGLSNAAVIFVADRSLTVPAVPLGTYYVRVRAVDESGVLGPPSPEITVVVDDGGPRCTTPPATPAGFKVDLSSGTDIAFGWNRVTGPCIPASYTVVVGSVAGGSDLAVFSVGPGFGFSFDVPRGTYYVRLIAVNEFGASGQSNEVVVVWGCSTAPAAPFGLAAAVSGSTVMLSWPRNPASCVPSTYDLHAGSAPGLTDIGVFPLGGAPGFVATAPSGTYFVRVVERNSEGVSPPSNEVRVVVP
jgi:hypothetical protein